jgi:hypothetical protein
MQTKRKVDGARTPQSPESTLITLPPAARRATAREHKDDVEGRIVEYLKDHPPTTAGDVTKGEEAE